MPAKKARRLKNQKVIAKRKQVRKLDEPARMVVTLKGEN